MQEKDASFTGLQDSEQKVLGFLEWLLHNIDLNNMNMQQKAIKAPQTQLDHAVQALSCVKKCQMGVSGRADGWSPKNSLIKGAFIRAKQMQAQLGSSLGVLDSKHLTNSQYSSYLDESWTFGTSPEHALKGMFMVVEAATATNCGLRAEDSRELRWPMLAFAEVVGNIKPAPTSLCTWDLGELATRHHTLAKLSGLPWLNTPCHSVALCWRLLAYWCNLNQLIKRSF